MLINHFSKRRHNGQEESKEETRQEDSQEEEREEEEVSYPLKGKLNVKGEPQGSLFY